ncbi:MAG: DNA polymerase III subunit beta [Chloroflexi bacterium]|nr:MAG: DNA polymerase III subunit beta [Chloroflexota bacterium]
MKITCKQQDLAKGLTVVGHAVSTRTTLPILSHILLATEGDQLRLSATNLDIGITCHVPAQVKEDGITTVPAKLFTDLITNLPPASIELSLAVDTQSLKVSSQRSQATIRGMDPADFPAIPSAEGGEPPVILDTATLREMINQTTFAAATDDARPVFTGVLARSQSNTLTFASADSFRLALRREPLPGAATSGDVLIPARALNELARILPAEGSVRMLVTPNRNQVLFEAEGIKLVSSLIVGQFPNFEAILPKSYATRAAINTADFRQAAKRVALFARDSSNIVRLRIDAGENGGITPGTVTLAANADDLGDAMEPLVAAVDGAGLEVIFNVRYLTDVLAVIDTEEVALELNSPDKPGVIKPNGASGGDYLYIIMPMHNAR